MVEHLQYIAGEEGISAEPAALNVIARKADGAMRDALSIFDQVAASSMGNVTYRSTVDNLNILDYEYYDRLVEAFLTADVPAALLIYKEIRDKGFDSQFFINGLAAHFRDLMVASSPSTIVLLEASDEARTAMASVAAKCTPAFLYKAMDLCNDADLNYRMASNKQLLVELTLIKLCQLLSPSHGESGAGEGRLRPIAKDSAPQSVVQAPSPAPKQAAATPVAYGPAPVKAPVAGAPKADYVPAPKTADRQRTTTLRTPGLSLKSSANRNDGGEESMTDNKPRRSSAFTDEQLKAAWGAIIEAHPKEHLLINAMRLAVPVRVEATRFGVTVESEAIRDAIAQSIDVLLSELRTRLDNDYINLEIVLNKGKATVTSLTDSEVFAVMKQHHPYLNTLIEDLHLTLQ